MSHYVKFTYQRARPDIAPFEAIAELNARRRKLLEQCLIGVDSNGIGFGNLSVRDGVSGNFYITGSATGGLPELTPTDCVRVVAFDFAKNWLRYEGAAIPSSESLTHTPRFMNPIQRSLRSFIVTTRFCGGRVSITFRQLRRPLCTARRKWRTKSCVCSR